MKTKTFDCVEMMHQGAKRVQESLKGMTVAEQLAYWQKGTAEMRKRQQQLRKKAKQE